MIAGLACIGLAAYDTIANHGSMLGSAGDITLFLAGVGIITGKTAYDIGVQVPTPPKQ